ncbi:MAG: hypothetical protein ACHQ7N_21370 [Candidatus Methylomirabilales bacterium]
MAVMVMLLAMLLIYCMARTAALQRAIHTLDSFRRETGGDRAETRTQAVILLGIYVTRLNGAFLVGILVYLCTSRVSTWYYGAGIVALCWIGSLLVGSADFLRLGRTEMMGLLRNHVAGHQRGESMKFSPAGDVVPASRECLSSRDSKRKAARPILTRGR